MGAIGRSDREDSASFLRYFGKQVRHFREKAGLSKAELARRLGYSEEQVRSVEMGRRIAKPDFVDKADGELGAEGVLALAKEDLQMARYPAFFRDVAKLEAEAVELHAYDTMVVNGLLQTESYARALFKMRRPHMDDDLIERRVAARIERQEIFTRKPAPMVSFVVEEAALQRPFGGREVHVEQLDHLLAVGRLRNVEIQVMPTRLADNLGVDGPFHLLTPKGKSQVAYVEVRENSALITDREEVRLFALWYGIIRAQALSPQDSLAFIEKMRGDA